MTTKPRQSAIECALLYELELAHMIIRHMLNQMTISQKFELAKQNFGGEGVTRANEREAVILRAKQCGEMGHD